ncbi:MAG: DUF2726 domain-containing protein [Thermoguttaceae bacterium]|nr:DUF2726 domain-containing protein [Thermoguttaceae bacterium]
MREYAKTYAQNIEGPEKPYNAARRELLTPTELKFFKILLPASAPFYVAMKVCLRDIAHTPDYDPDMRIRNNQQHLDFVLCNPQTFMPILVIELDDPSHLREKSQELDAKKDAILAAVGVPILRVQTAREYNRDELSAAIRKAMNAAAEPTPQLRHFFRFQ